MTRGCPPIDDDYFGDMTDEEISEMLHSPSTLLGATDDYAAIALPYPQGLDDHVVVRRQHHPDHETGVLMHIMAIATIVVGVPLLVGMLVVNHMDAKRDREEPWNV
jgi:hypothetical protein